MSNSNIISCADAKSQGLKRYYTGAACRNGHTTHAKHLRSWENDT